MGRVGDFFFPRFYYSDSVNPLAVVLARGSSVSETGMLLRFESEGREAGAARVTVDPVGRGGRGSVRARGRAHGGIDGRAAESVQVADAVHARGHAHAHAHGRDGTRGREDRL